jgi:protein-S-isoprenylcysteine O-methyltransferase Ste14
MWPLAVYVGLVLALFVRVGNPAQSRRHATELVVTPADVKLVRRQHRLFYALLLAAPVEWWWRGRPVGWTQLFGAALFLAGVLGYRAAGGALGEQLSPLLAPREPARLIERGPYGRLRHPMYLAELAIAVGMPGTLAAPASALLAVAFAAVLLHRIRLEEQVLRARLPEYAAYAARTYRLIPYVY